MGHGAPAHQVRPGQEQRPAPLGGSAQQQPQLGRRGVAFRRARAPPRLPHLLGQSRAHHVEVPREGLDRQDRPSHACSCSALYQVLTPHSLTNRAFTVIFLFLIIIIMLKQLFILFGDFDSVLKLIVYGVQRFYSR